MGIYKGPNKVGDSNIFRLYKAKIASLYSERSLLSAGLNFRACESIGETVDNTLRNELGIVQNMNWTVGLD